MANKFWVGGTGTWDNTDDTHWSTTTGGANDTTHPTSADTATFDAASGGGTVTVAADLDVSSLTFGAFTGTLDFSVNNNNITTGGVFGTGTGTRTLNMGDGTWTLTGNAVGGVWGFGTTTNLTFNANSSTIVVSGSQTTLSAIFGGVLTYNIITFGPQTGGIPVVTNTNMTVAALNIVPGTFVKFGGGSTVTITDAINWNSGGSLSGMIGVFSSDTAAAAATIHASAAGGAINYAILYHITFNTNAVSATNSIDFGLNNMAGGSITAPSAGGVIGVIGS